MAGAPVPTIGARGTSPRSTDGLTRAATLLCVLAVSSGMYVYAVLRLLKGLRAQRVEGGVYDGRRRVLMYGPPPGREAAAPWLGRQDRTGVVVWVSAEQPAEVLGTGEGRPIPSVVILYFAVATALLLGYVFGWLRLSAYKRLLKKRSEAARTGEPPRS